MTVLFPPTYSPNLDFKIFSTDRWTDPQTDQPTKVDIEAPPPGPRSLKITRNGIERKILGSAVKS